MVTLTLTCNLCQDKIEKGFGKKIPPAYKAPIQSLTKRIFLAKVSYDCFQWGKVYDVS